MMLKPKKLSRQKYSSKFFKKQTTRNVRKLNEKTNLLNLDGQISIIQQKQFNEYIDSQKIENKNQNYHQKRQSLSESNYSRLNQMRKNQRNNKETQLIINSKILQKPKCFAQRLSELKRSINFRSTLNRMNNLSKKQTAAPVYTQNNPQIISRNSLIKVKQVQTENITKKEQKFDKFVSLQSFLSNNKSHFKNLKFNINPINSKNNSDKFLLSKKKLVQMAYAKIIFKNPQKITDFNKHAINQSIFKSQKEELISLREHKISQIQMLKKSKLMILQNEKQQNIFRLSQSLKNMKYKKQLQKKEQEEKQSLLAYKMMFLKNEHAQQQSPSLKRASTSKKFARREMQY